MGKSWFSNRVLESLLVKGSDYLERDCNDLGEQLFLKCRDKGMDYQLQKKTQE